MERLSTALHNYHIEALHAMAKTLGLTMGEQPVRKAQLIGELTRHIPQVARSHIYIRGLSPAERGALAVVLAGDADAAATLSDVAVPLMLAGLVRAHYVPQGTRTALPTIQVVIQRLLHQGLLISLTEYGGRASLRTLEQVQHFGIAPEVRTALPQKLLPWPAPAPEAVQWDAPKTLQVETNDMRQMMRMLFFTWSELRRQPARLLKAGGMGKRDRRRIAEALNLDAEEELDVVSRYYEMLRALELVTVGDDTIAAVESDAATLFWGARLMGQLPVVLRAYTRSPTELPIDAALGHFTSYFEGISLQPAQTIREHAIDRLSDIAPLGWVPTELFQYLLCGGHPGGLAFGEVWLGYIYRGLSWYGDSFRRQLEEGLHQIESQLIDSVLDELHALGVVVYGYAPTEGERSSERPDAIRVSEVMRDYTIRVAGGPEVANHVASLSEPPWQVILQPDFQMLAMGPVPLRVLATLESFVRREKIDESVITYRITRDEAYEAFRSGETVPMILGYLNEATDQPVPQNIIRSLEEWYTQFERIIIRRHVRIFQAESPELLMELLEDSVLGQYLHQINEKIAWLSSEDSQPVQRRLQELEILPAYASSPERDIEESLVWRDEALTLNSPTPSIYVTGYLERIAEPRDDGWHLTPQSLERATTLGLDIEGIQTMLEKMTGRSLPGPWDKRLKAWGHYFGNAKVGDVRLLRLDHEDALAELRKADQQLHRWLRPFPGSPRTAIVDEGRWEEVQARLESWGIKVNMDRWW